MDSTRMQMIQQPKPKRDSFVVNSSDSNSENDTQEFHVKLLNSDQFETTLKPTKPPPIIEKLKQICDSESDSDASQLMEKLQLSETVSQTLLKKIYSHTPRKRISHPKKPEDEFEFSMEKLEISDDSPLKEMAQLESEETLKRDLADAMKESPIKEIKPKPEIRKEVQCLEILPDSEPSKFLFKTPNPIPKTKSTVKPGKRKLFSQKLFEEDQSHLMNPDVDVPELTRFSYNTTGEVDATCPDLIYVDLAHIEAKKRLERKRQKQIKMRTPKPTKVQDSGKKIIKKKAKKVETSDSSSESDDDYVPKPSTSKKTVKPKSKKIQDSGKKLAKKGKQVESDTSSCEFDDDFATPKPSKKPINKFKSGGGNCSSDASDVVEIASDSEGLGTDSSDDEEVIAADQKRRSIIGKLSFLASLTGIYFIIQNLR